MKCCQLIQQCQLAAEFRVFGDDIATEFCEISQIALWNLANFAAEKRWPCTSAVITQYHVRLVDISQCLWIFSSAYVSMQVQTLSGLFLLPCRRLRRQRKLFTSSYWTLRKTPWLLTELNQRIGSRWVVWHSGCRCSVSVVMLVLTVAVALGVSMFLWKDSIRTWKTMWRWKLLVTVESARAYFPPYIFSKGWLLKLKARHPLHLSQYFSPIMAAWWQHAVPSQEHLSSFSALTLLVGQREVHPACKSSAAAIPRKFSLGTGNLD